MGILDIVVAVYVGFGTLRGRAHGLADELMRLANALVASVCGIGLFKAMSGALATVLAPHVSGLTGFVVGFGGAYAGMRFLRTRLKEAIAKKVNEAHEKGGGALVGFVRAVVLAAAVIGAACLSGDGIAHKIVTEKTLLGQQLDRLLPAAEDE